MILEYKMHRNSDGNLIVPYFIEDPGYFQSPDNFTFVGWSPNVHKYKIPDAVIRILTLAALKTRLQAIHASNPFKLDDGTNLGVYINATVTQVDTMATNWWNLKEVV